MIAGLPAEAAYNATAVVSQQASTPTASTTLQSAATANGNGTSLTTTGYAWAVLTLNCASCSGGTTVNFEGTQDGTNWVGLNAVQLTTATVTSSTTASGITVWNVDVAGFASIRARISSYSAGTVTVTATALPNAPPSRVTKLDSSSSVNAVQSGTWTVQPGNTANTTAWLVTGTGGTFPATESGTWNVGLNGGSNTIGAVTQASGPWTSNITQWDSTALGAPSNYGTSPGAVTVPGVNAYVTNSGWTSPGAWTAAFGSEIGTLPNGDSVLSSDAITNGTSLNMLADVSCVFGISSSTIAASAYMGLYMEPLQEDGSTYGTGSWPTSASAYVPADNPVGTMPIYAAASTTAFAGMVPGIVVPPGTVKFGLYDQSGFTLTSATCKYRLYNQQP